MLETPLVLWTCRNGSHGPQERVVDGVSVAAPVAITVRTPDLGRAQQSVRVDETRPRQQGEPL